MRLVFAGTPETAVRSLEALLASRHDVIAVVTRPDAPSGRGRHVEASPVALRAAEAGIEVLKPAKARDPEFLDRLRALRPDCCPVVAYGALLPQAALDIPPRGWVNLHFSLLPAWRGAAPVQHAILHGDDVTGASTFELVAAMDAGPVYGVLTEPILPTDTTGSLLERLAVAGATLLTATLDGIEDGTLTAIPQTDDGVSFTTKITVADAEVDWKLPALAIDRLIRACTPDPGAWTTLEGNRVKLGPLATATAASAATPASASAPVPALAPGEVQLEKAAILVGTGTHPVRLGDVQAPGKRRMAATDWARGLRADVGTPVRFG